MVVQDGLSTALCSLLDQLSHHRQVFNRFNAEYFAALCTQLLLCTLSEVTTTCSLLLRVLCMCSDDDHIVDGIIRCKGLVSQLLNLLQYNPDNLTVFQGPLRLLTTIVSAVNSVPQIQAVMSGHHVYPILAQLLNKHGDTQHVREVCNALCAMSAWSQRRGAGHHQLRA